MSTWPSRQSVGPPPRRAAARPGSGAPGSAASSSHSKPASREPSRKQLLGRALVARRVDGVDADQLAEQLDRLGAELRSRGDRRLSPMRPGYPRRSLAAYSSGHERSGCSTPDEARRRGARSVPAAEAPLAVRMRPRDARRAGRPGAPARRGLDAADRDRVRRAALDGPLRAARAPARRRWRGSSPSARARRVRGGVGGQRRPRRGAGGDRARRGAPPRDRPADDLLPRRDPPLQQGPAGRAAARGRGGAGDADRGDHREPLLRGQLGAALALRRSTSCARSTPADVAELLERALADPERGIADPPRGRPTRRSSCSPRARAATRAPRSAALERAVEAARAAGGRGRPRDRRGRAAAQGGQLYDKRRRPALRLHLGLDQGDARLRPRRLALLPGGDARGRRGPALHRPADGDPRLRGHRQRRPAGAASSRPPPAQAVDRVGLPECALNLAQAAAYLALAPKSNASYAAISRGRGATSASTAPSCRRDYLRDAHYPGAKKLGRGEGYVYPHDEPGGVADQPLLPEEVAGRALLRAHRPRLRGRARASGSSGSAAAAGSTATADERQ